MAGRAKRVSELSREQVIDILRREMPYLKAKYGVEKIILYGSFAKGSQKKTSDVDILVGLRKTLGLEFLELADTLEEKLGRKVDIATLDHYKRSFGNPRYKHIAEDIEKSMIPV